MKSYSKQLGFRNGLMDVHLPKKMVKIGVEWCWSIPYWCIQHGDVSIVTWIPQLDGCWEEHQPLFQQKWWSSPFHEWLFPTQDWLIGSEYLKLLDPKKTTKSAWAHNHNTDCYSTQCGQIHWSIATLFSDRDHIACYSWSVQWNYWYLWCIWIHKYVYILYILLYILHNHIAQWIQAKTWKIHPIDRGLSSHPCLIFTPKSTPNWLGVRLRYAKIGWTDRY